MHQAFTETIATLSEAAPTPELRELLPDLRILAADRLQQAPEARQAFTAAAERIDLLTRDLRVLPIAATGPASSPDALPRPAKAPDASAENLGERLPLRFGFRGDRAPAVFALARIATMRRDRERHVANGFGILAA